jgi:hypothetical protein
MEIAQTLHVRKVRCELRYIPLWVAENWPPNAICFQLYNRQVYSMSLQATISAQNN